MTTKAKILTDHLPITPCKPEMRQAVIALATKHGLSIAEIQRQAMSLFLSKSDAESVKHDTKVSV